MGEGSKFLPKFGTKGRIIPPPGLPFFLLNVIHHFLPIGKTQHLEEIPRVLGVSPFIQPIKIPVLVEENTPGEIEVFGITITQLMHLMPFEEMSNEREVFF